MIRLIPPDPWVGWLPFAYQVSKRIITNDSISAVVTQSPPLSTNLIGYAIKKRHGLPWIADLLDEWTHHPGRKLRYRWQASLDKRLEDRILQAADEIVVTTSRYREVLASEWGPERGRSVSEIALGYDKEDFEGTILPGNDKFTLAFVGSLDRLREATFHEFCMAIESLMESGALDRERFRFRFVGHVRGNFRRFDNSVFGEVLEMTGHLPHKEAVNEMRKADALLLIRDPGRTIAIPGKTFEYMAAHRPILALTSKNGATASLLQSCRMATIVDPREGREVIAEALIKICQLWKNRELDNPAIYQGDFHRYEAAALTRSLAHLLDRISMA
jgi:glycosyltransferase involved in cell wall biosynthesis